VSIACATPPVDPARHRVVRVSDPREGRTAAMVITGVARLGSLVTLTALIVLGGAVCGLVDGTPTGHDTTVTIPFDGAGH
jgi:hypothetical protein